MKILFVLSALMLASAHANFFTELGANIKDVFSQVGHSLLAQLDNTGTTLLNAGVAAGKTLLSQGLQALALNTANALSGANSAKRDLSTLQRVESSLHQMMDSLVGELKGSLQYLVASLKATVNKVGTSLLSEIHEDVNKAVGLHNLLADSFLTAVKQKADQIITSLMPHTKRNAFTEFFKGIGTTIANTFSPVVDQVKNLATSAGNAIKDGAANLLINAYHAAGTLKDNLTPHLSNLGTALGTIAANGGNALNALKAASGDILTQTLTNMVKPVTDIKNTVTDAGNTVANTLGSLGTTN